MTENTKAQFFHGGGDTVKSVKLSAGKAKVGAYAVRFTGPREKDASGEYFTSRTDYGPKSGDGVATMFNHGIPLKGFEDLADATFPAATTRRDDTGIYAETTLDLSDPAEALIADLCGKGALKWSSGSANHIVRKGSDGEIKRWHIIELSFTPSPCDAGLPSIRPLKALAAERPTSTGFEYWNNVYDRHKFAREQEQAARRKQMQNWLAERMGAPITSPSFTSPTRKSTMPQYSIAAALKAATQKKPTGYEAEIHQELAKQLESAPAGFLIPLDALKAQNVGSAPAGGFLVGETIPTFADALRPASIAMQLGALYVDVRPNVTVPSISAGTQAYWLNEMETCPEGSASFSALTLKPRRCAAWLKVSNQLLSQSALADSVLSRDIRKAVGSALDLGIFSGVGGNEPTGLTNSNTIQNVTFGGAPTRALLASFERKLGDENADDRSAVWITSPAVREKWRKTLNDTVAGSGYLWDDGNRVLGRPARATSNVLGDRVVLGDFSEYIIASWGMVELTDPFSAARTGQTELLCTIHADGGPMQKKSFVASTDSATQ